MATLYPAQIDTTTQLPQPAGTNTLDNPDHAGAHTNMSLAVIAIENTVGTTAGTNVLKNFNAGDFPVRMNAGGTLQQAIAGTFTINNGTFNNAVIGTPSIAGGTANSFTLGTPTIQGTVINTANIIDAAITERKMKLDQLAGTTLTTGTTNSQTKTDIVGGSVTCVVNVASNVLITTSLANSNTGAVPTYITLLTDGTADSVWNDIAFINSASPGGCSFTAWRTGITAGTHNWRIQWRTSGSGTLTLTAFELVVIPFAN